MALPFAIRIEAPAVRFCRSPTGECGLESRLTISLSVRRSQQFFQAHEHYIGDAVENAGDDAHFGIAELCV